jgi:hypothetical protein
MVNVHLCRNTRNYLDKYRRRKLRVVRGDDAVMFADYLKIIIGGSKFFFLINLLMRVVYGIFFWIDGRGRIAYIYFHDMLVMDTTYLTNK